MVLEKIRTNFKLVALSFLICFPINSEPKIGALFHLSGYASHWGKSELDAVKLALNSYPRATLFIEDTRSEVKECLNAYRALVTLQKVQLVLGPTWTACYFAIGPLTDEFKVPIFAPSGTHYTSQPVHPLRFGLFYNPIDGVRKVVSYLVSKKVSSVSVVYTIEPFFLEMFEGLRTELQKSGIKLHFEKIQQKEKNFMPIIAKLQKADFYSCLCDKAEFFLFNKALKAVYGEVSNFYLGGLSDEILQAGLESTVFLDYHVNEDFIRLFREKYQYDPAPSALMAFEAANFAVSLLRSVKDLSPENIRNFSYQGKFLNVKFNQQNSLNFGNDFFKLVDKHKRFLF